jgi:TetR/AcrR family transcriptional regulator, transcriptional repressor for nem operon
MYIGFMDADPMSPLSEPKWTAKGRATRSRIINIAADQIYLHGISHVKTEEIQQLAGVSASQLYHYFKNKQELVHAVIRAQTSQILEAQGEALSTLDSLAAFRRWCDVVVAIQESKLNGGAGCALGKLASELGDTDEDAHHLLVEGFDRWKEPIRKGLETMRDRGDLESQIDADDLAEAILASLQGGLLLAQVRRNVLPLRQSLDMMLDYLAEKTMSSL